MAIDCCKSYVGKQIIGLLPGGAEECLYVLAINAEDYGSNFFGDWTIDGEIFSDYLAANFDGSIIYQNSIGYESCFVYYIGTQPTTINVTTEFATIPFTIRKVTDFEGGSCDYVCYQASFDYGYQWRFIDYFSSGNVLPEQLGLAISIEDDVTLYNELISFLGPQITVSSVWNGSQYVVTINNAFNLGGLQLGDGAPVYTAFTALPCEIVPPTPVPLALLDAYGGATAAYSVRKLSTSYVGSAIRVRRSSDNTEQDIGFVGLDLDTTALSSFVGANDGFVTTWYDQSGNAINLIQTTAADQPQIVSSGTIITQNGLSSISFDRTNSTFLQCSVGQESNFDFTSSFGFFFVVKPKTQTGDQILADKGQFNYGVSGYYFATSTSGNYVYSVLSRPAVTAPQLNASSTSLQVLSFNFGSGNYLTALNNTNTATTTGVLNILNNNTALHIGKYGGTGEDWDGWMSEIIIYPTSQSANRNGIETNMDNYFSLY